MKNNKLKIIISSIIILLPILVGLILWNSLPETLTTHWGIDGKPDGSTDKLFAVIALPLILLAVHLLCLFVTRFDPKNKNQSPKALGLIYFIMPVISLFSNGIIYLSAFGYSINAMAVVPVILGLTFIVIGNYMPKCRQNYTLGVKIKWTLENEENWNATHRFCGKVWTVGGIVLLFCAFLPGTASLWVSFVAILPMVIIPVVYSYVYSRKQKARGEYEVKKMPEMKHSKAIKVVSIVAVAVVLVFVAILMFTGDITVEYGDTSFTVDSTYMSALTVDYLTVDAVKYRDDIDFGVRVFGFGGAKLLAGRFQNKEFGDYTLYAYTTSKDAVVISADGKTLVIGGQNEAQTKAIYDEILSRTN